MKTIVSNISQFLGKWAVWLVVVAVLAALFGGLIFGLLSIFIFPWMSANETYLYTSMPWTEPTRLLLCATGMAITSFTLVTAFTLYDWLY